MAILKTAFSKLSGCFVAIVSVYTCSNLLRMRDFCLAFWLLLTIATNGFAQAPIGAPAAAPIRITLQDALAGARKYGAQIQSADLLVALAKQDRLQARDNLLPTLHAFNQFIYTQGNGTPSGVFVANDGVHVYNEQAVVHQDLFSIVRRGEIRRTKAAEAVAIARRDVAARGLNSTVVQDFYGIVVAARKLGNSQSNLTDAQQFLDITQKQQRGGEAARADVIKAQIQLQQRQRELSDAQVAVEKAKVTLAVLIFPDVTRDFSAVDDLDDAPPLGDPDVIHSQATANSPDLRAAQSTLTQTRSETTIAKYAYLPSFGVDFYYGIDANQFAINSALTQATGRSTLPNYQVENRHNLGYSAAITLDIPVWNWGATQSKVKQAHLRERQAQLDLGLTEKQLQANIQSAYLEARTAHDQIDSLRSSSELSADSLRLTTLRYKAGEATVLEVVDAESTLTLARNAYADGLARYRIALANIQTLTGHL
jgi:outer membrane protein TolC